MLTKIDKSNFCFFLAFSNFVAFNFGFHVHEKAMLLVTIPLGLDLIINNTHDAKCAQQIKNQVGPKGPGHKYFGVDDGVSGGGCCVVCVVVSVVVEFAGDVALARFTVV